MCCYIVHGVSTLMTTWDVFLPFEIRSQWEIRRIIVRKGKRLSVSKLRGSAGSDINTYYICIKTEERLFQKPVREMNTTVIVQEGNQYKRHILENLRKM